jgi:hypothetical protein
MFKKVGCVPVMIIPEQEQDAGSSEVLDTTGSGTTSLENSSVPGTRAMV